MTIEEAIQHCEEVAKEQDKLRKHYDDASRYARSHNKDIVSINAKKCLECFECAKEHRQLAEWLTELKMYKQAFGIACELLNDCILYGYDADKIFEIMMDKDGVVDAESYEKFILEHLSELRGEQ